MINLDSMLPGMFKSDHAHSDSEHWWHNSPVNFSNLSLQYKPNLLQKLYIQTTSAGDIALRTSLSGLLTTTAIPNAVTPNKLALEKENQQFYMDIASAGQAHKFFKKPSKDIKVEESFINKVKFAPPDGHYHKLSFHSPYRPANPNLLDDYIYHHFNIKAHAQYWTHRSGPRPTICVVHGFVASHYQFNSVFFDIPKLFNQGYDVLLYTLPFHGARKGPNAPFSGFDIFANGFSSLCESMAHAVYDFRVFLNYLEERGAPSFGVTGISLGGYTSALLAAVEDRLSFSIPIVPVASIYDAMQIWFPVNKVVNTALMLSGIDKNDVRHQLASHSPLTYKPVIDKERLMVIAGAGDRITPPQHSEAIAKHWGGAQLEYFPGGHVVHLQKRRYQKKIDEFFNKIGFLPS